MLALTAFVIATILNTAEQPAAMISYQVASDQRSAIHIQIPYTFGTHDMVAHSVRGGIEARAGSLGFVSGGFSVPISAIEAGNGTLACHMRESLGLDYTKSKFPGEHVCADGRLPASGNDSIAFPEIAFQVTGTHFVDDVARFLAGASARIEVHGRWTIHGISRDQTMTLLATPAGGPQHPAAVLKLTGKTTIHLAAHGIQVKPALIIHAGDDATVDFNLMLAEKP